MNGALNAFNPSCFSEHTTGMSCFLDKTNSNSILPSLLLRWFKKKKTRNHMSSIETLENAPFQRSKGGCGGGDRLHPDIKQLPFWMAVEGSDTLLRHGKCIRKLSMRPGLPAPDSSARGETRFRADFLRCLQNKQRYLKRPDWKHTPRCVTSLCSLFLRHAR